MVQKPSKIREFQKRFPTEDACLTHLMRSRYGERFTCFSCQKEATYYRVKARRCFTCHSGEGMRGWTQVTGLSAWDAARWVAGDRHEPDSMRLKLENTACLKCHAADLRSAAPGRVAHGLAPADFHKLSEHRGVAASCVACHTAHTAGAPAKDYMNDVRVQRECARCHPSGLGTESDL